jgi:sulfate adenylyltransferase subunit 2
MDVWQYAKIEEIELPNLYFSHGREVLERNGSLLAVSEFVTPRENENPSDQIVRFRTIGDATCTGAVRSEAKTIDEVIAEVAASRITERGSRADDRRSEAAMEDRKKQGYF